MKLRAGDLVFQILFAGVHLSNIAITLGAHIRNLPKSDPRLP
jgi:hypothetical protein